MDLPEFFTLIEHDSVTSTNDVARELAAKGAAEGTMVTARKQSAGRGRRGKMWASPVGNLYMSCVMRPVCTPVEATQLGFVAAVALWDAICDIDYPGIPLKLKWPNDVLLDGRKVSGILLESATADGGRVDWVVIGIGVNTSHHPEDSAWPAGDLRQTRDQPNPDDLLPFVARHLVDYYHVWQRDGFAPIRHLWLEETYFAPGQRVTIGRGETAVSGLFETLDETGALVLRLDNGNRAVVSYGEVSPSN